MKVMRFNLRQFLSGALIGVMVTLGTVMSGSANAAQCATPRDQVALDARVLQTELMVAALACQNQANYNAFVRKFRIQLVEQGRSLRKMFERQHGKAASRHLNALVTRLANEASQRSMAKRAGFCQEANLLFAEAMQIEPTSFQELVEKPAIQGRHGVPLCGAGRMVGYGTAAE